MGVYARISKIERDVEKFFQLLNSLSERVKEIEATLRVVKIYPEHFFDLPDFIRLSFRALVKFGGSATATQVSSLTNRARAVESARLNELYRMGIVHKVRKGKVVFFTLKKQVSVSSKETRFSDAFS